MSWSSGRRGDQVTKERNSQFSNFCCFSAAVFLSITDLPVAFSCQQTIIAQALAPNSTSPKPPGRRPKCNPPAPAAAEPWSRNQLIKGRVFFSLLLSQFLKLASALQRPNPTQVRNTRTTVAVSGGYSRESAVVVFAEKTQLNGMLGLCWCLIGPSLYRFVYPIS